MNRLNLLRYNFDKQGLKKLDDIKDQTGFTDIMEADNKGTTDYGITSGISDDCALSETVPIPTESPDVKNFPKMLALS